MEATCSKSLPETVSEFNFIKFEKLVQTRVVASGFRHFYAFLFKRLKTFLDLCSFVNIFQLSQNKIYGNLLCIQIAYSARKNSLVEA